jgi:hypothetical protein
VIVEPRRIVASSVASLDPGLVGAQARERILHAAAALPYGTSFVGFECRLGGDDDRVDFGTGVSAHDGGRELVERSASNDGAMVNDPWRSLRRACSAWRSDPALARSMPAIFTELDLVGDGEPGEPSLFARLEWPRRTSWRDELADAYRAARVFLDACYGGPAEPRHYRVVDECVAALPPNAWLHGVAAMLGRPERNPRLGLWIPRWHLRAYAERLGLHVLAEDLAYLTQEIPDTRGPIVELALDVTESGISLRIGVEFTIEQDGLLRGSQLLTRLVAVGLCGGAKAAALAGWPGSEALLVAAPDWSACRLVRRVSHLKLVLEPGPRVHAKAYLTATPSFSLFR